MEKFKTSYTEEEWNEMYEDEKITVICPFCEQRGYSIPLGRKILEPNEPRPADYDEWLQCPTCYEVIPIHEVPAEETIKDTIETTDNAFENKFILESIPKRNSEKGKRASAKKRQKKIKLDDDKEIDTLLRVYGDRVNVLK